MKVAEYRCLGCGLSYSGAPGPTSCPRCGHAYIQWLNVKLWHPDCPESIFPARSPLPTRLAAA